METLTSLNLHPNCICIQTVVLIQSTLAIVDPDTPSYQRIVQ